MLKTELETMKQWQSSQYHEVPEPHTDVQSPERNSTPPHQTTESVLNSCHLMSSSDVPLKNNFEVLQDVQEDSSQILEMTNAQESTTQQQETKNQKRDPEMMSKGIKGSNEPTRE